MMTGPGVIQLMSLREQVYEHLRESIEAGALEPGTFLDQNRISADLGISRTPLRDALLQLDLEGFVEVLPRRGVRVRQLTLDDIRHLYEIIGALESSEIDTLGRLNDAMSAALDTADFDEYYGLNLDFHGVFLSRSDNEELKRTVRVCRQRLYDFPRERAFVPEWERRSIEEHTELVALIREQDLRAAADFLRDVHWSFEVQKPFLLRYYHLDESGGGPE